MAGKPLVEAAAVRSWLLSLDEETLRKAIAGDESEIRLFFASEYGGNKAKPTEQEITAAAYYAKLLTPSVVTAAGSE